MSYSINTQKWLFITCFNAVFPVGNVLVLIAPSFLVLVAKNCFELWAISALVSYKHCYT